MVKAHAAQCMPWTTTWDSQVVLPEVWAWPARLYCRQICGSSQSGSQV